MVARKVMPREEAFRFVARMGAAALAGEPMPDWPGDSDVIRTGDMADAMHEFTRRLAERFDKIPAKASDDLVIQEAIRRQLDDVMSSAALRVEEAVKRFLS